MSSYPEPEQTRTSSTYAQFVDESGKSHKDILRIESGWGDRMYKNHSLSTPLEDFIQELYETGYEEVIRKGRQELSEAQISSDKKASLKTVRLAKGLSQHELAKKAGVQQYQISRYEAGKEYPSAPTIVKLCRALGIDQNTFFKLLEID